MWTTLVDIKNALRTLTFQTNYVYIEVPKLTQAMVEIRRWTQEFERRMIRVEGQLSDRRDAPPKGGFLIAQNPEDSGQWDVRNARGVERQVKKSDPSELLDALEMRAEVRTYRGLKSRGATIASHVAAVALTAGLAILWSMIHR
jgi:hypothetical protein